MRRAGPEPAIHPAPVTMLRYGLLVSCVLAVSLAPARAGAQSQGEDLRRTIADLDAAVFTAFNDRDLDRFMTFFATDLEFYHDADGLSGYADMVESSRRLFSQASPLRREMIPGSMEVHAVPGHGAIQIARHEFCHRERGARDCGVFGFTHVWRLQDERWQITRVLSYGH